MKFDMEAFKRNEFAVHCKSKEEIKSFFHFMNWNLGWYTDNILTFNERCFRYCKCNNINMTWTHCDLNYYINAGYDIVEWSDYMEKEEYKPPFKNSYVGGIEMEENIVVKNKICKSFLKDGMVVETAEGKFYLVLNDKIIRQNSCLLLERYNEDLTKSEKGLENFNIIRIYKTKAINLNNIFKKENLELLATRINEELSKFTDTELYHELIARGVIR